MTGRPAAAAVHQAAPADFSAYSMDGPNTGCPANLDNPWHFPAEGICAECGAVIRANNPGGEWVHTGRMPGDPR